MTILTDILRVHIHQTGPMTLEQFMEICLLHPTHGYYNRPVPIGAAGSFITAPEISQMFGEVIGLALAASWQELGSPSAFVLLDLGPGRGTLMADCLRATAQVPGFNTSARLHLFEASRTLRAEQSACLRAHAPVWLKVLEELPALPLLAVANEFFDALPIRQFRRDPAGWSECVIGLRDEQLSMGFVPLKNGAADKGLFRHRTVGDIVEIRPSAKRIIATLAEHIAAQGGLLLVIDYGDTTLTGTTFQATTDHQTADPLAAPGTADLTAHVDFGSLIQAAEALAHAGPCPQGAYLERLGITARARALTAGLAGTALKEHAAAFQRLVHPDEMGHLFKVLALYPHTAPQPPGFS